MHIYMYIYSPGHEEVAAGCGYERRHQTYQVVIHIAGIPVYIYSGIYISSSICETVWFSISTTHQFSIVQICIMQVCAHCYIYLNVVVEAAITVETIELS